jgi:hypothetical protein
MREHDSFHDPAHSLDWDFGKCGADISDVAFYGVLHDCWSRY